MPVEASIGYTFRNKALLKEALTHPSAGGTSNQRLEFLGDSVLGLAVARMLFQQFPGENEGELARRHAALVCGGTIVDVAREIGLGQHLRMAASETANGGRDNPTNLEDACEALIGALYLDGGLPAAEAFIEAHWLPRLHATAAPPKDAKTALQEWAQGRGLPLPAYRVTASQGPSHAPVFTIEASVQGHPPAAATAGSKRVAEQAAAKLLLERLE